MEVICDICGKEVRKKSLKGHIKIYHTHEVDMLCMLCKKGFTSKIFFIDSKFCL